MFFELLLYSLLLGNAAHIDMRKTRSRRKVAITQFGRQENRVCEWRTPTKRSSEACKEKGSVMRSARVDKTSSTFDGGISHQRLGDDFNLHVE